MRFRRATAILGPVQDERIYKVLLPLLLVAFVVSSIGKDKTLGQGGTYWIGASGWFAFGVLLLTTIVFTVVVAIRAVARRPKGRMLPDIEDARSQRLALRRKD